ncbi:MAG: hypothetical protein IH623_02000 [Verrucomicrobia bacterium]|nr:hypothetical protein [Verrucomicrobiota bacterium]
MALCLMRVPASNYPYVAVTNRPGESSAFVLKRLADELSACSVCEVYYGKCVLETKQDSLRLVGGGFKEFPSWIFGGTDKGFNVPPGPTALSVSYETNRVVLRWENGAVYDSVGVFIDSFPLGWVWPGTTTQIVYDERHAGYGFIRSFSRDADFNIMVVGTKDGTPSNGAGVCLREHTLQESLMNVPFSQGIAPGFQSWVHKTADGIEFEQGELPGMAAGGETRDFHGKGFYQVLKGQGAFSGGVSRRFLGLIPGHTYRVGARLNTLESKDRNWSFSFHAAYNPASGGDLTPAQMAGEAALPNGARGKAAGQIAKCESATTTDGKWVERSSGKKTPENLTGDITLPAKGSDSITIWFRLEGKDIGETAVGLDSVTINDLGRAESGTAP